MNVIIELQYLISLAVPSSNMITTRQWNDVAIREQKIEINQWVDRIFQLN